MDKNNKTLVIFSNDKGHKYLKICVNGNVLFIFQLRSIRFPCIDDSAHMLGIMGSQGTTSQNTHSGRDRQSLGSGNTISALIDLPLCRMGFLFWHGWNRMFRLWDNRAGHRGDSHRTSTESNLETHIRQQSRSSDGAHGSMDTRLHT
jgi:hypothetical protein